MISKTLMPLKPGLKVASQMPAEPTSEDFAFNRQMGVQYAVTWVDADKASADYYEGRRKEFEDNGIQLYGLGNNSVHNVDAIVLNLANRDAKVDEYKRHLLNLGAAGIPYTTYAHMANSVWSTPPEQTRGGARARAFDLNRVDEGSGAGIFSGELTHQRPYSEDELWDNYESFIREVAPIAEDAGVRVGIHPDDPPGLTLGGVPRPIFSSFDGYKRAIEIADSPNIGLCLCLGCWLEGGDSMGQGPLEAIRYFGGLGKIFKVHYRTVDQPLPHFIEAFVDNGYFDMYQAMKALGEVGFDGVSIPDHIPQMADDGRIGTAYTIAWMKAAVVRANAELI